MRQCECEHAGFCTRHNISKDETLFQLCKQNRDIFLEYEVETGNIEAPSFTQRVVNYTVAATEHVMLGFQVVSDQIYKDRLAICSGCPLFQAGICLECGCPIEKKAKWAEQQCPLDPPKWLSIVTSSGCKSCNK